MFLFSGDKMHCSIVNLLYAIVFWSHWTEKSETWIGGLFGLCHFSNVTLSHDSTSDDLVYKNMIVMLLLFDALSFLYLCFLPFCFF